MVESEWLAEVLRVLDLGGTALALYVLFRDRIRALAITDRYIAFLERQNDHLRAVQENVLELTDPQKP